MYFDIHQIESEMLTVGRILEKIGNILMIIGGSVIGFIFISVFVSGSWSESPKLIQMWGNFIRPIADIPFIGNFIFTVWIIVFIGPGFLIGVLGNKITKLVVNNVS